MEDTVLHRAMGRVEGKVDGLEKQLADIKAIVINNADNSRRVEERVDVIEKSHARFTGFVAACSAIGGVAATWVFKKISPLV